MKLIGVYFAGRWWREPWMFPIYLYREVRDFYMRGMYGYASSDLWHLASHLADTMPYALRQMKKESSPWIGWEDTDLEKMARGFEIVKEQEGVFDAKEWEKLEVERKECMKHFIDNYHALWW